MMQDDFVMADVNMEGFQLIRGQYFSRQADPVMTLWKSAVGFNAPSYTALNNCEAVQFFVHPTERKIIIKPSPSKEPDSVNWTKDALQAKTNRLECTMFTRRLFRQWDLDENLRYRTNGKLVRSNRSVMLLFDFTEPEVWDGTKMVKESV
ncbi:MAG: hypothetical protein IKP38_08125 [Clostridia bacterium]|nr:hypothetical protein [Clostridia bacterium]